MEGSQYDFISTGFFISFRYSSIWGCLTFTGFYTAYSQGNSNTGKEKQKPTIQ